MSKKTKIFECIRNIYDHSASLFLILLICADFAFIALHSINALTPILNDSFYSIEKQRGYAELYQYLKWFWIIILLAYISILRRSFSYLAWGLVFAYLLCDDVLSIHETMGRYIAGNLTLKPPFDALGELTVSVAAGMIMLPLVICAYLYGSKTFKKMSHDMLILIFALAFFGVVVDLAHFSIQLGSGVNFILGIIEEGGEMFVASLILWYVFLLSVRDENAMSYLSDIVRAALK